MAKPLPKFRSTKSLKGVYNNLEMANSHRLLTNQAKEDWTCLIDKIRSSGPSVRERSGHIVQLFHLECETTTSRIPTAIRDSFFVVCSNRFSLLCLGRRPSRRPNRWRRDLWNWTRQLATVSSNRALFFIIRSMEIDTFDTFNNRNDQSVFLTTIKRVNLHPTV